MIFGGVDNVGSKVFQTDPSGACWSYKAVSIGIESDSVREILEVNYKEDMSFENAVLLAVECFSKVIEGKLEPKKIKLVTIPLRTKKFTVLSDDEIVDYVGKIG